MTRTNTLSAILALGILSTAGCAHGGQREKAMHNIATPKTLDEVKGYARGEWTSLTVELRPSEDRTGTGKVLPMRLTRRFEFRSDDSFVGRIRMFADDYGQLPLMEFEFRGHLVWGAAHPIAEGAWNLDYVLDEGFGVTPLHEQATAMLNQIPTPGLAPFQVGVQQDILRKAFPMFGITEGQVVSDYDLIYFRNGLLFMGAKHVDGTPFDRPERRPHQLQVPLLRVDPSGA